MTTTPVRRASVTAMTGSTAASLQALIGHEQLLRLAGEASFARGQAYYSGGHVRSVRFDGEVLVATVAGNLDYRVKLSSEGGTLAYSCSCPIGEQGGFCKHCVSAALAWLAAADDDDTAAGGTLLVTMEDIRAYLSGLERDALVDMIVAQAREDDGLHQRLLLRAARAKDKDLDPGVWRQAIDEAVGSAGFVPYAEAYGYAQRIGEVIDSFEELLDEGNAGMVIGLAEYGLAAVERALERVDDSNGEVGGLLHRLKDLHLAGCEQSAPDPEALARRLFAWELNGVWDTFSGAAATYADVLGERGLALYRRLAEAEWAKVPALAPGQNDPERYGKRYRITSIMETLAWMSGDVEARVAVKSRDLSLPYAFLQIAEIYKEASQPDRALDWAERGWRAFAGTRADERLRAFLADAYHDRGRHDEAMALIWQAFADQPSFTAYQTLKRHAERGGQSRWPAWRDKALACIRERLTATPGKRAEPGGIFPAFPWADRRTGRSLLVEIFLWEEDAEAAWREAKEGGCSRQLWLKLAALREKAHPQDALAIYREQIPLILPQTGSGDYPEAIRFLRKIQDLLSVLGRADEFPRYTAELRVMHRRKRNFIKLLDQEGW